MARTRTAPPARRRLRPPAPSIDGILASVAANASDPAVRRLAQRFLDEDDAGAAHPPSDNTARQAADR